MSVRSVFTLSSGRSGTHYLASVIQANAANCTCIHESFYFNPSMFGPPIHAYAVGNEAAIRLLVDRKQKFIARLKCQTYVETSHAFLKSYWHLAPEYFPNLRLIHVVRDPLKVARSEAHRYFMAERWHFPFRDYRAPDGQSYPRWALTGLEPIYRTFDLNSLTLFQRFLIQWIEIENRAMQCLDRFQLHDSCFFLQSIQDVNDPAKIGALFDFLGLQRRRESLYFPHSSHAKNVNPGRFRLTTDEEQEQAQAVLRQLPAESFRIFQRPPYSQLPWAARFTQLMRSNDLAPPTTPVLSNLPINQLVRD